MKIGNFGKKFLSIIVINTIIVGLVGGNLKFSYADSEYMNPSCDVSENSKKNVIFETVENSAILQNCDFGDQITAQITTEITTADIVISELNTDVLKLQGQTSPFEGDGTEINPYKISNKKELVTMSNLVNTENYKYADKYYILTNDIDLFGIDWIPIGLNYDLPFKGSFDGNNKNISNLSVGSETNYNDEFENIGFFGLVDGVTIKNLNLKAKIFSNYKYEYHPIFIGLLAGQVIGEKSTISKVCVSGIIKNRYSSQNNDGIFVAKNEGEIIDCVAKGTICSKSAGGFAGTNYGKIISCLAYVDVEVSLNGGGFVSANEGKIESCSVEGNIKLKAIEYMDNLNNLVGGFASTNIRLIDNCVANVDISQSSEFIISKDNNVKIGGFVGQTFSNGQKISNCISSGNIEIEKDYLTNGSVGSFGGGLSQIIENCGSVGNIKINKGSTLNGVFAGEALHAKISNCYVAGIMNFMGTFEQNSFFENMDDSTINHIYYNKDVVQGLWVEKTDMENTINDALAIPEYQMKSLSGEPGALVDILNTNRLFEKKEADWNGWVIRADQNKGFPVFGDSKPVPSTYTVTFESDGGSIIDTQTVNAGETAVRPTAPVKAGYIFKGWYKAKDLIQVWDFDTEKVIADTMLYAKWIKNFNVNFYMDGGEIVKPPVYEKAGYIFKGWYKDKELVNPWDCGKDKLIEDAVLYASWEKI